ncbi:hypothetical protein Calhy_1780 [Caldicellulosiruptor hydrothermalis 108]|uniref:Uncharacterized protein n=1 Tax=Caldicellulosiruptor hydrothermalis (strain DSM 18901 / VKM B-2411 / 108) TaxID=632292 RepID=E4QD01_CALH1|nr:hypothetical protein Calhy_1780 [Caldicellulosiruptor hydrothermalis 108]
MGNKNNVKSNYCIKVLNKQTLCIARKGLSNYLFLTAPVLICPQNFLFKIFLLSPQPLSTHLR